MAIKWRQNTNQNTENVKNSKGNEIQGERDLRMSIHAHHGRETDTNQTRVTVVGIEGHYTLSQVILANSAS